MLTTWSCALLCAFAAGLVSLSGAVLLSLKEQWLTRLLIYLVAFAAGAMLGNSFFHLLPEAYAHLRASETAWMCMGGFLAFFLLEQLLHTHAGGHTRPVKHYAYLSLYADSIHNFTDGILIASAWMAGPEAGMATTTAVVLHELPQEVSDLGILLKAGFTWRKSLLFNFYASCTSVLGAALTLWLGERLGQWSAYALPFAAGGFLYLAATALLPEIMKHKSRRNTWTCLLCLLAGIIAMSCFATKGVHAH